MYGDAIEASHPRGRPRFKLKDGSITLNNTTLLIKQGLVESPAL